MSRAVRGLSLLAVLASLGSACGGSKAADPCAGCAGCCASGVCQPGTADATCGTGGGACSSCAADQSCQSGQCTARPAASTIGNKCSVDADCGAGFICAASVPGGGYCTKDCTANAAACPILSTCVATSATAKLCLKSCASSADCRTEHLCFASGSGGLCLPKCARDADCGSSHCDVASGRCQASRVGNACASDSECGDKPAFCNTSASGGYCSLPCGGDPNTTAPCPPGSNCGSAGGPASSCLKACTSDPDCRAGQRCGDSGGGARSCLPKCTADSDCGAAARCDVASGACVPGGPAAGQLGGACTNTASCALGAGAVCATNGYPGGYCSIDCGANTAVCGAGGTCVAFSSTARFCLSNCRTPRDCRPGYICYPLGAGFSSVCTPSCTSNADCGSGQVCDASTGLCVTPVAGTSTVTPVELASAAAPVAVHSSTLSVGLSVTLPADAISVTFVGQAADPAALIVVYRIETPDGRIYDYGTPGSPMKVLPSPTPGVFSVLAPNSPTAPFSPGVWTIKLLASKETTATVTALIKKNTQAPLATGSIDLNLFFVGMPRISAATAPTDPDFKTIFDQVKRIWAQAGIGIGNVTYNDITGADLARFQDLKESELGLLMQKSLTPGARDNALNVFFVHSIQGGALDGYIILGESAGIPGVPLRGTSGSGLAVTGADFPRAAGLADIADTWVHEGSHWLGLFHTTESRGTAFDPLPDTPECPATPNDNNPHDGIMQPAECRNFDAGNEMFWTSVAEIPHSQLSPNQQFVLLRNPAVH